MPAQARVRFIHRSRSIQYPMLAALRACRAWEQVDLDPGDELVYVEDAAPGDEMLMKGEIDFILGSHVTPYLRYDEGVPFVYLGQTVNSIDDAVLSAKPINGVEDLKGLRIAGHIDRPRHDYQNHVLYLRRAGIPEDGVEWIAVDAHADAIEIIENGVADAIFVPAPAVRRARAKGIPVFVPEILPMVVGSTLTTLWPHVQANPDLFKRALQALRIGISFFIDEPEAMKKVLTDDVAKAMHIEDQEALDELYIRNAGLLERTLYPDNQAVTNAFELAVMQRPDLRGRLSPLALWDLHFLRELDAAS